MNIVKIIREMLSSFRLNTWFRIWGELFVPATLASYPNFNIISFIFIFFLTSPLTWSAAYLLNDLSDISLDKQHELRRKRVNTINQIGGGNIIRIIILLLFCAFFLSLFSNWIISILLGLLIINQMFYTLKPFRLKEVFLLDILCNSVNSIIRYFLGWFSQSPTHPLLIAPLIFIVLAKLVFFIGHRMQNRQLEIKNNINSTVTRLTMNQIYFLIGLIIITELLLYFYCLAKKIFPWSSALAFIPITIIFYYYFIKRKIFIFQMEKDLNFRNHLYLAYFFSMSILGLTILFLNF